MKTHYTIALIQLKLLQDILPQRRKFMPVIRRNMFAYSMHNFYFSKHSFINANEVLGLKELVYKAKHRKLYCSYKNKKYIEYNSFSQQVAYTQILREVGRTIKVED